jgi:ornithine lipid ester-linked acyl 2-hydroxylase
MFHLVFFIFLGAIKMFFQSNEFDFVSILESSWLLIKQELEQLKSEQFIDWPEKNICKKKWEVFGLYAYGIKINDNCQLCPQTTRLVDMIPGITTAGFSWLKPETHILPHIGYSNGVLRCHLGLIIPDNKCALRVGNQTKNWQEGKCLIFDDTIEHEAWNYSNANRIVLLIDFKNPYLTENNNQSMACSPEVAQLIRNLSINNSKITG